jgi:nitrogen-specific signal transduction histidine kinase/CheY-like chemotaxis protein
VYQLNARKLSSSAENDSVLLLAFQDVTERLRVEEGMRELARMEAIGQLAGGVAHEINNHMTVLMGFMAFVTRDIPPDHPKRSDLHRAEEAADHVVYITRQLLNFSRKQMIKREIIDPWTAVLQLRRLLGRLLGSGIELNMARRGDLESVDADPAQLGEVFVNLAMNARYAMEGTGRFEIALSAVEVAEGAPSSFLDQPPGRYVRFEISDTGPGMEEQVQRRVFEPFFTTKPVGEGTGLGLAGVFGVVAQHGGFIRVESQLGSGTRFIIELPEVAAAVTGADLSRAPEPMPQGRETIIVAEDDDGVRDWIGRVLRECGYTVLEAQDGAKGLRLFAENAESVGLVLTDLVMPGVGGREIGELMAVDAPHIPLLYMSSYADEEIERRHVSMPAGGLLQKPFSALVLAQRVRAAIDSADRRSEPRLP